MHWNQIKSLLILSFLILNIYLFVEFTGKKQEQDIGVLEHNNSSIEEILKEESIRINNLPEKEYEETFITVSQHEFTDNALTVLKEEKAQTPFLFNDYFIASKLDKGIPIPKDINKETTQELLREIGYASEEYTFWNWNENLNVLIFFQNKMDRPVYYNQNGLVLLFLNDANEVTYYLQSMLGETETLSESRELIKPIRAIEILYRANELRSNDAIESVNIGFHTRIPFESGVQVFAPIWKVNINNETNYFVNAIEGFTFSTKEEEFLMETIEVAIKRMKAKKENAKEIEFIVNELEKKIEHLLKDEVE